MTLMHLLGSGSLGHIQVLGNAKLANNKLVNFEAPYPRARLHQATNSKCAKRKRADRSAPGQ